ncbi:MAG TPA: hypothetical protein VEA81_10475 [Burkholderiaceae bacterium]|nr:hypothetical protein [Burkholderiaceae bacterium]
MHVDTVTVHRRFNGPPASGNGGWVSGLLAERLGAPAAEVSLRAPPPLDAPLEVRRRPDGTLALHHGDVLLAEARAAGLSVDVPASPGLERAAAAGAIGRMLAHGRPGDPYSRCFGCGIERADGLRILPSPVGDDGLVATDWTPAADLAGADGLLPAPVAWAALDCPAGIAWSHRLPDAPPMMTVRMTASIDRPLRAGERYVAMGWPIAREGRKLHAGTAIVASDGEVVARSLQLWLLPRTD